MTANDQIRRMTIEGMGPSEITRALNDAGIRNSRGTIYSVQRVHQVVLEQFDDRETVREFGRCRRGFVQSLEALKEAAQTDAEAASVHAVYLRERKGGADVLDAAERALAVA